jgi:hypothetical protein
VAERRLFAGVVVRLARAANITVPDARAGAAPANLDV